MYTYLHLGCFQRRLQVFSALPNPIDYNQLEYFPWLSELIMFTVRTRAFSACFVESALLCLEVCSWKLLSDPVNPPTVTFLRPYIHIYEAILGRAVLRCLPYELHHLLLRKNKRAAIASPRFSLCTLIKNPFHFKLKCRL